MKKPQGAPAALATALIPAAGFGARFHEGGPKALVPLRGKPMLLHALERLAASGRLRSAVIAVSPGHEDVFRKALADTRVPCLLVEGGVTRRESVARAFLAAKLESDDELVLVHDAARPLVDPVEVAAVVDAAAKTGAAIAGYSVVETIKRVHGGAVVETVPRERPLRGHDAPGLPGGPPPACGGERGRPGNHRRRAARGADRRPGDRRPDVALEHQDHVPRRPRVGRGLPRARLT